VTKIKYAGYECEVHQVETEDGYKIKFHRMKPKTRSVVPRLGPVFLMHGLYATGENFIKMGPEIALRELELVENKIS
jgi:hypothetical protein